MSVQYTIDIQLTELGFPDILQPQESLSTSWDDSLSSCPSPALPTSDLPRESQLVKGQLKGPQACASPVLQAVGSPALQAVASPALQAVASPALQAVASPALQAVASPVLRSPPCQQLQPSYSGQETSRLATPSQGDGTKPPVPQEPLEDSDSDDSDVSVVCQEDEEEDDDDEDGLDNDLTNSGDYVCSVCGLRLPSNFKLLDHMNLHTGARPYCCAECGKRFSQIHNYRVHLRKHGQNKADRPHCRICLMSFASPKSLEHHLSNTHFEKQFYECDLCKRVFTNLKACEHHVELHKAMPEIVCKKCGRHFSQAKSLKRHQKKACHRIFKCTDCSETFSNKNLLLKHSFSHLGLLPYTCIRCRCHFRLAKLYRQHKCEPGRIHCVACLREFSCQVDFIQHKKDTGCWGSCDVKGDEIRCLECGLSFSTNEELKKHGGAHQRVLKCAECGKGFRSALLLMSHMGGHAGNSPCLCQSCGLGFPHQQNYDSHLKTCGQKPQPAKPATATKKHPSLKKRNLETVPTTNDTRNPAPALPEPIHVQNNTAAPITDPAVLQVGTGDIPSSDGCWKLTLDKIPPPGANLVLFVAEGLTFQPTISQAVPEVKNLAADQQLGVWRTIQDAECEPMDLSKKASNSTQSNVPPPVFKSEPMECEVSGEAERQELSDCVMDLTTTNSVVKTEPQSPDSSQKP
ncbi:zinc finger protein 79 [Phycodurus eques]|uniref:zinc finger protein 79 n=1 Tax=Phycodurus eques TaxID=693459 RepID=UPI002ACE8246|nr:zinc finger protein 79 [Phycodurus eques]